MKKILSATFVTFILFSSCLKNLGSSCDYNECSTVATQSEIQAWQNYLASNNLTATQHCSGLFYRIENAGSGSSPGQCSNISVRYKGYFPGGNVFDETTSAVVINLPIALKGWRNALPLINSGGRIVLYIAPSLGYGGQEIRDANGNVVIPPNSYLIFEVDLDAVL
jgi:FKBP-type peptidyl-prolyl cis-trans isomerase FkpA